MASDCCFDDATGTPTYLIGLMTPSGTSYGDLDVVAALRIACEPDARINLATRDVVVGLGRVGREHELRLQRVPLPDRGQPLLRLLPVGGDCGVARRELGGLLEIIGAVDARRVALRDEDRERVARERHALLGGGETLGRERRRPPPDSPTGTRRPAPRLRSASRAGPWHRSCRRASRRSPSRTPVRPR